MGMNNVVFLEVIEWFDDTGLEVLHRIPQEGSGEIKYGAQLVVRESQAAVFFYNGRAYDPFGPGRHTLTTGNIPLLNKVLALPFGGTSPLRAEVCFVNMRVLANLKWGTRDPVAFKDSQLGLIRLRAFGLFNCQVVQPVLFVNRMVGTRATYTAEDIESYLSRVIVSRFNDFLGEKLDTILDLPGHYDELSGGLEERLQQDFSHFGLGLSKLYINAITPPPEVQQAIDDKSRLGVFDDLDKLIKMKAAMAIEKASETEGASGTGLGMGLGLLMPAMFAGALKGAPPEATSHCPDCSQPVARDAKFCPHCGHQLLVFDQCRNCGKNLAPHAKFCSRCGQVVGPAAPEPKCRHCGAVNLEHSTFCNQCGERL